MGVFVNGHLVHEGLPADPVSVRTTMELST